MMSKSYKDRLQQHIDENLAYEILGQLQNELEANHTNENEYDLYNTVKANTEFQTVSLNKTKTEDNSDTKYSLALKLFLEKFIQNNQQDFDRLQEEYTALQIVKEDFKATANEKIFQDKEGNYFKLINKKYERQENIFSVLEDGSYVTLNTVKTCYTLYTTYDKQDCPIALKVLRKDAPVYMNESVNVLNLKKEVVQKAKRIGYSGHSFDLIANIINTFVAPVESGYYMDNKYRFYKWNFKKACFEYHDRNGISIGSPNLADYEPKGKIVIRTDYNGSGLYC